MQPRKKGLHRAVLTPDIISRKRAIGAFGGTKGNPDIEADLAVHPEQVGNDPELPLADLRQQPHLFRGEQIIVQQHLSAGVHGLPHHHIVHQLHGTHARQNPPGLLHAGGGLQAFQQSSAQSAFAHPAHLFGTGSGKRAGILSAA
ncbi:hypothetical protein D3C76_1367410 [compost metagenome]